MYISPAAAPEWEKAKTAFSGESEIAERGYRLLPSAPERCHRVEDARESGGKVEAEKSVLHASEQLCVSPALSCPVQRTFQQNNLAPQILPVVFGDKSKCIYYVTFISSFIPEYNVPPCQSTP